MKLTFMRRLLLVALALLVVSPQPARSQAWEILGRDGIVAMAASGDSALWALTYNGYAIRTTDRFETLSYLRVATTGEFREMAFANEMLGCVLGTAGYHMTADGGKTWVSRPYPTEGWFSSLVALPDETFHFIDDEGRVYSSATMEVGTVPLDTAYVQQLVATTDGYLIGRTPFGLIQSSNGGASWSVMTAMPRCADMAFTDRDHAVLRVDGRWNEWYKVTRDGGQTWDSLYTSFKNLSRLDSTTILAGKHLISIKDGTVRETREMPPTHWDYIKFGESIVRSRGVEIDVSSDSCKSWNMIVSIEHPGTAAMNVNRLGHFTQQSEYSHLGLMRSIDAGFSWRSLPRFSISSHTWFDDVRAYGTQGNILARTTDGAQSWETILIDSSAYPILSSLTRDVINSHDRVYVADDRLYVVEGDSVNVIPSPIDQIFSITVRGDRIILLGRVGFSTYLSYALSDDAGTSWTLYDDLYFTVGEFYLLEDSLIVARQPEELLISTDNGLTWRRLTRLPFREVYHLSAAKVIATTSKEIYASVDSGRSWHLRMPSFTLPNFAYFKSIDVVNDTVYIPGDVFLLRTSVDDLFEGVVPLAIKPGPSDRLILSVTPNPAQGVINVSGVANEELHIYSASGGRVATYWIATSGKLDVSTLPSGVYLLEASGQTARFVIHR